jgi:hypothetical protein
MWVGTTVLGRGIWLTLTSERLKYLIQLPVSSVENRRVLVYCAGKRGNFTEAVANINQRTLRRVAQSMVNRANACIQENSGHFQHLL